MIHEEKQILRKRMKATVRALADKPKASMTIRDSLYASKLWAEAAVIYGYVPMASEPDWLGDLWPEQKELAFPRTNAEGGMRFFLSREFQVGPWKAHEPVGEEIAPPPDLILVPGLAFDRDGHRVGRGGGFYDRWLAEWPGLVKVGLGFECQIVEHAPREPHDTRMDAVITEAGIIYI